MGTQGRKVLHGRAVARAPGTCGELLQGFLDGEYFLVTCPVNQWSVVEIAVGSKPVGDSRLLGQFIPGSEATVSGGRTEPGKKMEGPGRLGPSPPVRHFQCRAGAATAEQGSRGACGPAAEKTLKAVRQTLGRTTPGMISLVEVTVTLYSQLPAGKGCGSSTADITAAALAAAALTGEVPGPDELAALAVSIEPSDGIMYPGVVAFDHLGGVLLEELGHPPPMEVIVVDPGGSVDTVAFNRREGLVDLNRANEPVIRAAWDYISFGFATGCPESIALGATLSARVKQENFPNPVFEPALALAKKCGALGVNVAHSGTVVGVLFDPRKVQAREVFPYLAENLPGCRLWPTELTGGGAVLVTLPGEGGEGVADGE